MYLYRCFNCHTLSPKPTSRHKGTRRHKAEVAAFEAGWVLGLTLKGQAEESCPKCAHLLYDTVKMTPFWQFKLIKITQQEYAVVRSDGVSVGKVKKILSNWYFAPDNNKYLSFPVRTRKLAVGLVVSFKFDKTAAEINLNKIGFIES